MVDWKGEELTLEAPAGTDLYRRPGKEFSNAPFRLIASPEGAFSVSVHVSCNLTGQYQQAGLLLSSSETTLQQNDLWIKAGVELWQGRPRASVVVTRGEFGSDWSVADWPSSDHPAGASSYFVSFWIRLSRSMDGTIVVDIKYTEDGAWNFLRKTYGWGTAPVRIGLMSAAPEAGPAFSTDYSDFRLL
ncbi:hypothetical protein BC830DRAFT_1117536 [Chytriomyces sp. MP71]|nr:hypothetical protein BC830DRAFT_1117536 [Chytriomyces sp. MP71]